MKLEDIDVTKTYWYTRLSFSYQSFRVTGSIRPVEVRLSVEADGESCVKLSLRKVDGIYIQSFYLTTYNIADFDLENYGIFETENEAIEHWNKLILNQMDKLQNYYETKLKYLTNKKINKK